jgi:hypothetical protein
MAEVKTFVAGVSQGAVNLTARNAVEPQASEDRGMAGMIREDNPPTVTSVPAVPESQEPMSGYDPLDAVITALSARYPGNYRKEEVLAACLLISAGAFRGRKIDMGCVNTTMKEWFVKIGVCYTNTGLPTFAFKKLVIRLASLQLRYECQGVAKLTCPHCFTYPITPSHACPSNGGGLHE